jgi:thiazole synthase/sulfur carrier protein
MDEISIRVNGEARSVKRGTTVAALLGELGVETGRVAVERNHDVVPRREYERTILAAGDRLEVVAFVGGG